MRHGARTCADQRSMSQDWMMPRGCEAVETCATECSHSRWPKISLYGLTKKPMICASSACGTGRRCLRQPCGLARFFRGGTWHRKFLTHLPLTVHSPRSLLLDRGKNGLDSADLKSRNESRRGGQREYVRVRLCFARICHLGQCPQ